MLGFLKINALIEFFKPKTKTISIDEVIRIIKEDNELLRIVSQNKISENDLEKIHDQLTVYGAGQYINGYFVATHCLLNPSTLSLITGHYEDGKFKVENLDHYNSLFFLIDQVSQHFRQNNMETSKKQT